MSVDGKECSEVLLVNQTLQCDLPAGTGVSVSVVVTLSVVYDGCDGWTQIFSSSPVYLLGYGMPEVIGITHELCTGTSNTSLIECPRTGSSTLTITGTNLGTAGGVVLLGSEGECSNVYHLSSTEVHCVLPEGIGEDMGLIFIQAGGAMSLGQATVSRVQCQAGSYQAASELTCAICAAGKYSAVTGSSECSLCVPGSAQDQTGQNTCMLCEAGTSQNQSGRSSCSVCVSGQYSAATGSSECSPCAPGSSQNKTAQTYCELCSIGTYKNSSGSAECDMCLNGTSNSVAGSLGCSVDCVTTDAPIPIDVPTTVDVSSEYVPPLAAVVCESSLFVNHMEEILTVVVAVLLLFLICALVSRSRKNTELKKAIEAVNTHIYSLSSDLIYILINRFI